MAIIKTRSRIVSFRVSEEEYHVLLELSARQGARSVSEFARTLAFLSPSRNSPVAEVKAQAQIHDLKERFQELTSEVQELRQRIEEGFTLLQQHQYKLAAFPSIEHVPIR